MTIEVEIFKKYKPTEDGWISNTKFRQAIHDAYEAGRLNAKQEDYSRVEELKPKLKADMMAIIEPEIQREKAKTAQAIFWDLKHYHICKDEAFCCQYCVEGIGTCPCYDALKAKYLKAST